MTIQEYLQNPYGKGSSFSNIGKQKEDLEIQFKKMYDKIIAKIYRYRDFVIYHVVVPSETNENNTYDVILEVETKHLEDNATTIENIPFKVFSNCPSFIFTYANVFKTNNLLCDWLLIKYNKDVRYSAPVNRNSNNIIGFEKSLYCAMRYLHVSGKTRIEVTKTSAKKISSRSEIISAVRTQIQIMEMVKTKVRPDEIKGKTIVGNTDPVFGSKSIKKPTHSEEDKRFTKNTKIEKTVKSISQSKVNKNTKGIKSTKKF